MEQKELDQMNIDAITLESILIQATGLAERLNKQVVNLANERKDNV